VSTYSGTVPVTATDRATNASVRVFTVERDATPPQVWVSAPADVIGGAFTVTWEAVDAQAGVAYYDLDVSVDGGPWQRILTGTLSTTHTQICTLANFYTFCLLPRTTSRTAPLSLLARASYASRSTTTAPLSRCAVDCRCERRRGTGCIATTVSHAPLLPHLQRALRARLPQRLEQEQRL